MGKKIRLAAWLEGTDSARGRNRTMARVWLVQLGLHKDTTRNEDRLGCAACRQLGVHATCEEVTIQVVWFVKNDSACVCWTWLRLTRWSMIDEGSSTTLLHSWRTRRKTTRHERRRRRDGDSARHLVVRRRTNLIDGGAMRRLNNDERNGRRRSKGWRLGLGFCDGFLRMKKMNSVSHFTRGLFKENNNNNNFFFSFPLFFSKQNLYLLSFHLIPI